MEDKIIEINKFSETEVKIEEVIPEKIVPEERTSKIISLKQLEEEKGNYEQQKQQLIEWRKTPEQEIEKINNNIRDIENQISIVDGYIQSAIDKGVVRELPPEPVTPEVPEETPTEQPII